MPLLLTNHAHNKEVRASARRDWRRGCSDETVDRLVSNEDAMRRLLSEFESIDEVGTLRRCNKSLLATIDGHAMLWRSIQYSPPGLARLSSFGIHTERVLRKGALEVCCPARARVQAPPWRPPACPRHRDRAAQGRRGIAQHRGGGRGVGRAREEDAWEKGAGKLRGRR